MSKPKQQNAQPSPMEYEVVRMPNLTNERGRLAREAASLSKDELVERAVSVGVPADGTKEEIAERVKDAVRAERT